MERGLGETEVGEQGDMFDFSLFVPYVLMLLADRYI